MKEEPGLTPLAIAIPEEHPVQLLAAIAPEQPTAENMDLARERELPTSPVRREHVRATTGFGGNAPCLGPVPVPRADCLLRPSRIVGRVYDSLCNLEATSKQDDWMQSLEEQTKMQASLLGCVSYFDNPNRYLSDTDCEIRLPVPVWHAYGYSPRWAHLATRQMIQEIENKIKTDPRAVAVGPIGLDARLERVDMAQQRELMQELIEMATWQHLPVLTYCHASGTNDELSAFYDLLKHSFSRDPICILAEGLSAETIEALLTLGSHIYFGVTLGLAEPAIQKPWPAEGLALLSIPLERMLFQSLAPDQLSNPWMTATLHEQVARLRGLEPRVLEVVLAANFRRFFAKSASPQQTTL